jgi:hypothetical protein
MSRMNIGGYFCNDGRVERWSDGGHKAGAGAAVPEIWPKRGLERMVTFAVLRCEQRRPSYDLQTRTSNGRLRTLILDSSAARSGAMPL